MPLIALNNLGGRCPCVKQIAKLFSNCLRCANALCFIEPVGSVRSGVSRFNGRLLAADADPQVLEGKWNRNKIVLLSFPDEKSFFEWEQPPDYQEIAVDRKAGADAVVLLVRGMA